MSNNNILKRKKDLLLKIFLSITLSILFLIIIIKPDKQPDVNIEANNLSGGYQIIEEGENNRAEYGIIEETDATGGFGYGYIRNRKDKIEKNGLLELNNSVNDSAFIDNLREKFTSESIKMYAHSGINYALIDNQHLYFENTDFTRVVGFNGSIFLGVMINTEGKIDSIYYLSSSETPAYLQKIFRNNYFSQFQGLSTDKSHTIDAVSGATITSVAIAKAVNEAYMVGKDSFLSDYLSTSEMNFSVKSELNRMWIVNLVILVLLFFALNLKSIRKRKILTGIYIFTVLWLGFYLNSSFTWIMFEKFFRNTQLSVFAISYIALILYVSIWHNNTYCRYICPFGNAQRLIYKISPFKKYKIKIKNKYLKNFRYAITIFIIAGYLFGINIFSQYEPFPYFFGHNISTIMFFLSVGVVILSAFIPNIWCRALCPTGCTLDLLKLKVDL